MRKYLLLLALMVGFGTYGFATNKIEIKTQKPQKEDKTVTKKKVEKYDFSLFKLVKSSTKKVNTDSTKTSEEKHNFNKAKDETTDLYAKPRDLFRLSYAS